MPIPVFLVEDTPAVRALVAELLATVGDFHVVGTAGTEVQACRWLQEHPGTWELAIVDLVLEQGTGMGVIAAGRAAAPGAKIVVFSDYATSGIRKHCFKLGADAVFRKGEELSALTDFCRALAGGAPPVDRTPTAPRM